VADFVRRRWAVVAALFVIMFGAAIPLTAYGVFLPILADEFGWSRGSVSLALTINLLVGGLAGFAIGTLGDRHGPRAPLLATAVLAGTGFALVARVQALWHLYLFVGVMAGIGMSTFYVLSTSTVVRWFEAQRGLALAIVLTGYSVGVMAGGPIAAGLIARFGWRMAYMLLGLGLVVVGGASSLLVSLPSAARPGRAATRARALRIDRSAVTLGSALRDARLWVLAVSWLLSGATLMMVSVHGVPFARDRGMPLEMAALALTSYGLGAVVGRIAAGTAVDRFGALPIMLACSGLQIMGLVPLLHVSSPGPLLLLFGLFGMGALGGDAVLVKAVPDVFGLAALAGIVGVLALGWRAGAALGPAAAGFLYDATGSYAASFRVAPFAVVASFVLFARAVRRP
jgi:MFS transporter, OFA family, oxalate/formate antiporter